MLLFLSSQCLTLGSSFPYNLIENVVTTFCASLLAYKQTFLDPSVKHWDDIIGTLGLHPDNRHPATC
ncbi:hypothetical protein [Wolbachia endosymbiont (group A) of Ophion costatus]|uniref:hypothetical protein n=1 Tax=Wolbachia endosymbiont (group A) of Ophion costatus TaxID=3066209 RepID=UPI0030D36A0E